MLRDTCIVVDPSDTVTGAASKMDCHRFDESTPTGHLHRAFSVFLFDSHDRLLIQQRALDKKTFPGVCAPRYMLASAALPFLCCCNTLLIECDTSVALAGELSSAYFRSTERSDVWAPGLVTNKMLVQVWTNTCCSHPLHGQTPDEADEANAVLSGRVGGTVSAAIRKLEHELGIPAAALDRRDFVFLTRLLYCAADADASSGQSTGWGEHELDYILFLRADVPLKPHSEEVSDTKYVTPDELRAMMRPETGLRWSPWFRIIADNFLFKWWDNLGGTLGGKHADWGTVHRLQC